MSYKLLIFENYFPILAKQYITKMYVLKYFDTILAAKLPTISVLHQKQKYSNYLLYSPNSRFCFICQLSTIQPTFSTVPPKCRLFVIPNVKFVYHDLTDILGCMLVVLVIQLVWCFSQLTFLITGISHYVCKLLDVIANVKLGQLTRHAPYRLVSYRLAYLKTQT